MKYLLTVISCLLILVNQGKAQNDIDSLKFVLDNYNSIDTVRVNLLNQIGFEYWIVDPEQSDNYGEQAAALANQLGFTKGEAFAHRVIGVGHWTRGNYELGLIELLKSLDLYKSLEDKLGIANCNLNIGLIYSDQQNYDRALTNYFEAITAFELLARNDRLATTYNKVGEVYIAQDEFDQAYDYLIKALNIHQTNGFRYGIAESNNRLGLLFLKRSQYERGLDYLFQGLEISVEINDKQGVARSYENIGRAYLSNGNLSNAQMYLEKGVEASKEVSSKRWLRDIYQDLKVLAVKRKNYAQALQYNDMFMAMKDSLFNEQMANRIAELEKKNEMAVKERELDALKLERSLLEERDRLNSMLKLLMAALLVLLLVSGYLIITKQRNRIKLDKEYHAAQHLLAEVELQNSQLREQELQKELDFKNKELTSYTINFIRKNEVMEELRTAVQETRKMASAEVSSKLGKLNRIIDNTLDVDKDWEDFRLYFENVHKDFFKNLKTSFPDLGNSELKLCALVKLNLNMKETAAIMGISAESVKTARYRLRKKLDPPKEQTLTDFIMTLG